MTDRLPPWVIRNDAGEYRSMVGWSRHRHQAVSFDTAGEARAWIEATPAVKGFAANEPFDATAEALSRAGAGLEPAVPLTTMAQHDYEPVR